MKRAIEDNQKCWHSKLRISLWADRITPKREIGNSHFMLVYGREERLPISIKFPSLELVHQLELVKNDAMTTRLAEVMELEEKRQQVMHTLEVHQQQVKRSFDKKATTKVFKEGDLVLKWDENRVKLGRHSKFDTIWSGPYTIINYKEANSFKLCKPNGDFLPILVN